MKLKDFCSITVCGCDVEIKEEYTGHIFTDEECKKDLDNMMGRKVCEIIFRNNKLQICIL